jgi:hypothetical protein
MVLLIGSVAAQTTIEIYNEEDNTIVLKLKSKDNIDTFNKIVLVYDSNQITLESTSPLAKKIITSNPVWTNVNTTATASSYFVVDEEEDIELEEWMMKPFAIKNSSTDLLTDEEEDIPLEPWMTDLSTWN